MSPNLTCHHIIVDGVTLFFPKQLWRWEGTYHFPNQTRRPWIDDQVPRFRLFPSQCYIMARAFHVRASESPRQRQVRGEANYYHHKATFEKRSKLGIPVYTWQHRLCSGLIAIVYKYTCPFLWASDSRNGVPASPGCDLQTLFVVVLSLGRPLFLNAGRILHP